MLILYHPLHFSLQKNWKCNLCEKLFPLKKIPIVFIFPLIPLLFSLYYLFPWFSHYFPLQKNWKCNLCEKLFPLKKIVWKSGPVKFCAPCYVQIQERKIRKQFAVAEEAPNELLDPLEGVQIVRETTGEENGAK